MENSFQTSFIPKKPMSSMKVARTSKTGFLTIFSILLLVGCGVAAGWLLFYKASLLKQEDTLSASLAQAGKSFDKDTIAQLELYDNRIKVSKPLLDNHIVLSPLFTLLGQLTIPSVQYTKFQDSSDEHGFTVSMSGIARDYKGIALQSDAFNSSQGSSFKNVVFSNLAKDSNGNVTFDLTFTVDPALLSYEKNTALEVTGTTPTQDTQPTGGVILPNTTNATTQPTSSTTPNITN